MTDPLESNLLKLSMVRREQGQRERRVALVAGGAALIALLATAGLSAYSATVAGQITELQTQHAELVADNLKLEADNVDLDLKRQKLIADNTALEARNIALDLRLDGVPADRLDEFQTPASRAPLEAADAAITALETTVPVAGRDATNVVYYSRGIDPPQLSASLLRLHFTVDTRASTSPNPTNAVFYSANVPLDHVRLVALAVMRAGTEIHVITPYTGRSTVQVGFAPRGRDVSRFPAYTAERVRTATSFRD